MYSLFYNLNDRPFKLAPDLKYYFNSRPHKRAVVHMRFGFEQRDGILLLTGDKGIGKTTLTFHLLDELDKHDNIIAFLQKPSPNDSDFLPAILTSLQIPISEYHPKLMFNTLRAFLMKQLELNHKVLLVVDEAQDLSANCLEFIRLLSAIRVNEEGIIQVLLVGNNDLESVIATQTNQSFRQQIVMSYNMHPLQVSDTKAYIQYRLRIAGWEDDPLIDDEIYEAIHHMTGGVPYEINRYCDRILMLGMLQQTHHLKRANIEHLTSMTVELLDHYSAKQAESDSSIPIKSIESSENVFETSDSNSAERQSNQAAAETQFEDVSTNGSGKSRFFDKETLITIAVAYVISLVMVVFMNKYSSEHTHEQSAVTAVAKTDNSNDMPVIVDTPKPATQQEIKQNSSPEKTTHDPLSQIPNEIEGSHDSEKHVASIDETINHEEILPEMLVAHEPVSGSSKLSSTDILNPSSTGTIASSNDIESENIPFIDDIDQFEGDAPVSESTIVSAEPVESLTSETTEETDKPLPVELAKAELSENRFIAPQIEPRLDAIKLNHLVSQFEVAYQFGDLMQIGKLFSLNIVSNNIDGKQTLMDEYQKLFTITEFRRMRIFDMQWRIGDHLAVGEGGFEAIIREKGSRKKQKYKGSIILHVKEEEKGLEITELYYNYENL